MARTTRCLLAGLCLLVPASLNTQTPSQSGAVEITQGAAPMSVDRIPIVAGAIPVKEAVSEADEEDACIRCHKEEVDSFARSKMAHSMRPPMHEPDGTVRTPQATLRMHSNRDGTWQSLESNGSIETYRVNNVIGSGTHASGYLVSLASHLFQSPVAFYRRQAAYGLAPGYETRNFSRRVFLPYRSKLLCDSKVICRIRVLSSVSKLPRFHAGWGLLQRFLRSHARLMHGNIGILLEAVPISLAVHELPKFGLKARTTNPCIPRVLFVCD